MRRLNLYVENEPFSLTRSLCGDFSQSEYENDQINKTNPPVQKKEDFFAEFDERNEHACEKATTKEHANANDETSFNPLTWCDSTEYPKLSSKKIDDVVVNSYDPMTPGNAEEFFDKNQTSALIQNRNKFSAVLDELGNAKKYKMYEELDESRDDTISSKKQEVDCDCDSSRNVLAHGSDNTLKTGQQEGCNTEGGDGSVYAGCCIL